jgi:2,3-dihydroxybiphenyl 1,2-dioxygenase
MVVQGLGYIGVGTSNLGDWSEFATTGVGMQAVDRGAAGMAFRMDDRRQRLILDRSLPDGERYFGWEMADATALDALATKLDAAGVEVRREPAARADQRFVRELISFSDPAGNRLEAFHGAMQADDPFQPGRPISGFRTGPLGMGHFVLLVPRMDDVLPFYLDLLGFGISDYITKPHPGYFLHANPRHHSVALFEAGRSGMHHLMVEYYMLDDVGQSYDIAQREPGRVKVALGRHPNDLMTSFYMRSPGAFLVECGWGAREVDVATCQPQELASVASFWGHQGLFESLADGPPTPGAPRMSPTPGARAPLQVLDGNYNRLNGACPWWDGISGRR